MDISNLIIYQSIFFGKRKVINRGKAKRHLMGSFVTLWARLLRRDFFPREQIEATHNLRIELEKVRCSKKSGIFCGITKRALGDRPLQRGGRETFADT